MKFTHFIYRIYLSINGKSIGVSLLVFLRFFSMGVVVIFKRILQFFTLFSYFTPVLRNCYYILGGWLIKKPFLVYFFLLLLFLIRYAIYCFLIKHEPAIIFQSTTFRTVPSISQIKDFFKFNTPTNFNFIHYIKALTKFKPKDNDDMDPISNFFVSIVLESISEYIATSVNNFITALTTTSSELANNQPIEATQAQFNIEPSIPETIVLEKDILNNNLPFEAPIDIVVTEDNELITYIAQENTLQGAILNTIYAPGTNGPRIYSDDTIFNFHIKIIDIIKNNINTFDVINNKNAIHLIREKVHDYLLNTNLLNNITAADLQNTNHLFNLLISEFIINSILVDEQEYFIIYNICGALIIEVICHVQHLSTHDFYNDPDIFAQTVDAIIIRFIPK